MSDAPVAPSAPSTPAPSNTPSPETAKSSAPQQTNEMFEVKVNGKTVKMTRQQVIDNASMSTAAQEKFSEAKKSRAEADRIINSAKTNPIEALMDPALGLSKDQIRAAFEKWYSKEYIEPEALTPDQRKMKEYEEKVKKYEEQEKTAKEKAEADENEKLTNRQREFLQGQIIEALESSGLPKTKFFASRMAFYMRQNMQNGWEAPISMIVQQVKNERQGMMTDMSEGSTAEQLIAALGENVINKIRKHDLEQLRAKRNVQAPQLNGSKPSGATSTGIKKASWSEVQSRLRDFRRKGF